MSDTRAFSTHLGGGSTATVITTMALGSLWVMLIVVLAATGTFDTPRSEPALPTLIAVSTPVAGFLIAMAVAPRFRRAMLALDPVLLTALQAWRILGGAFLIVLAFGLLPGFFAWPAGLGDIAVGIAAPFVAMRLRHNPRFLTSGRYLAFLLFGLADFALAITTGILSRNAIDGLVGHVTSAAMGQLPLVLIPTIAVPAFVILHLIVASQIISAHRESR